MQILILGMHRSGTSMTARLLNTMGVYFAPEGASTGANEENPKGFWERRDVRALNDQLLHAAKADWHRLGGFSLKAIPELTLAFFRKEAAKIILSMDAHRPWFLKEPRLSVLAPLWLELLEFPVCVFVHRSPLEVAASLKTRNGFPITFSCALWEFYNTAALNATLGLPRVQVNHRDLVRDPIRTLHLLREGLESYGVRGLRSPSDDEVLAFVDHSLIRAKATQEDNLLTPAQQKLYEAFETGATLRLSKPVSCSRKARSVLRAHDRRVDPENKVGKLEADNARMKAELAATTQAKAELQKALADTRAGLAEKSSKLVAANQAKIELQKALAELRAGLADKGAKLLLSDRTKSEVEKSLANLNAKWSASNQAKAELQKVLADMRSTLGQKSEDLRNARQNLEKAELEIQTTNRFRETLSEQRESLREQIESLREQIESLRGSWQADATNARIKELCEAIAGSDTRIQEITRSMERMANDFAAGKEQVKKLRQLLKKAAAEIDHIHQSSRWKAGSVVLLRPRKVKKNEAREKYIGGYESWLTEKKKTWSKIPIAVAEAEPAAAETPSQPAGSHFREFDYQSIERICRQLQIPVSIVVPVYNGTIDLERCVNSVLRYATVPFELILVDDCSTDPATRALLGRYEDHRAIRVLSGTENRGFVRSANVGMQAARHDVVLLNSDTEVTPNWLQKLVVAGYSHPRIATVTPFSNAAGAFSVPEVGVNAPLPFPFTPLKMSRLIERLSSHAYPEVPTGNGFCMYIKRQVLEEIGGFDEENFGRGYGEENDFCMRARKAGWRNVINDSLFVFHRGNSSFGEEKQELLKRNRETLDRLHPNYTGLVREFTTSATINALRARIGDALRSGEADPETQIEKRRILYILHEGTGGVPMTNADLVSKVSDTEQCFLLTSSGAEMILREWRHDGAVELRRWKLPAPWSAGKFRQPALAEIYFQVLVGLGIELVHIRHLFKHSFDAPFLCRLLGIPIVLSFHDYYFVCPSIHLLDQHGNFCGGSCTPGLAQCTIPSVMLQDLPVLKTYLSEWRERVSDVLECCDAFVTTAESVRAIHVRSFPTLEKKPFWVIAHGRDFESLPALAAPPLSGTPVRILVPGNVGFSKGSYFIRQLDELDVEKTLEFHFLGQPNNELQGIGVHHGPYRREEFAQFVQRIRPYFAAIFSIWAETYSHTLSEAWSAGLPVLGSNLGAVAERIQACGAGWLVDTTDAARTLAQIRQIIASPQDYEEKVRAIKDAGMPTRQQMADAYRALYDYVDANRSGEKPTRVGCIVPVGHRGSTFVRIRLPLAHETIKDRLLISQLPSRFSEKELVTWIDRLELQTILVQREAVNMKDATLLVATCRAKGIRIALDIDDNLLEIDESHVEFNSYREARATIRYLAEAADQVIASTSNLAQSFRPLNPNVSVIGNALDEWLWFSPIARSSDTLPADSVVAGYMGTKTHGADLELIREPFLEARECLLRDHGLRLTLQLVGGTDESADADGWYQRLEVPKGCTAYPRFVRWLRKTVRWDFALAPLAPNPINRAKSGLKFLEYSGLGVSAIFSSVGEYPEVVEDRQTGLVAKTNRTEEWKQLILELATSRSLRERLAVNAQRETRSRYLLRHTASAWLARLDADFALVDAELGTPATTSR